ncbi:hypothetical protein [Streptomyces sp. NPDC005046]
MVQELSRIGGEQVGSPAVPFRSGLVLGYLTDAEAGQEVVQTGDVLALGSGRGGLQGEERKVSFVPTEAKPELSCPEFCSGRFVWFQAALVVAWVQ